MAAKRPSNLALASLEKKDDSPLIDAEAVPRKRTKAAHVIPNLDILPELTKLFDLVSQAASQTETDQQDLEGKILDQVRAFGCNNLEARR